MLYVGNTKYKIHIGSNSYKIATPYDYEVEWISRIEPTQYIDTGFTSQDNFNSFYVEVIDFKGGCGQILGAHQGNWANRIGITSWANTNSIECRVANNDFLSFSCTTGANYKIYMKHSYAWVNGEIKNEPRAGGMCYVDKPIYLFTTNANGTSIEENSTELKLGNVRIFSRGIMVRNFIPVVKNGVGYMYDTVQSKLYDNKGSGSFGIGPIKEKTTLLPYDNTVSCITSKNNESYIRIDRRFNTADPRVWIKFSKGTQTSENPCVFGGAENLTYHPNLNFWFFWNNNDEIKVKTGNQGTDWTLVVPSIINEATLKKGTLTLNGTPYVFGNYFSGVATYSEVTLGTLISNNLNNLKNYAFNGSFYGVKIWEGENLLDEFIPVSWDGLGCLYNIYNKHLYISYGPGDFTAGPEL